MAKYPIISRDPAIQAEYVQMRKAGTSHSIAEICATRTAPGLQTDTRFMTGRDQNEFYSRQLRTWVGSRADVRRACEAQGFNCEGGVSHRVTNDNPRPDELPYRVANDIVEDAVLDILDDEPTALKDDPELPLKVRKRLEGDANEPSKKLLF